MGMIVAIRAQWPQLEVHRGAGVLKLESEVGGIASVSHPYALLEPGVPTGIGPYRQTVLIFKGAQQLEAIPVADVEVLLIGRKTMPWGPFSSWASRRNRPSFQEKTPLKGNSLRGSSKNFGRPTRSHGAARRPRRSSGDRRRAIPQTGRIPGPGPYGTTRIRKDSEAIAAVGQRAEDIDMHVIGRHFLSLEISPEPFTALLIALDRRPSDQI